MANEKQAPEVSGCQPMRETAAGALHGLAKRRYREADQLTQLAKFAEQIEPGSPADEALWELVISNRR